jgi:hypothetical protein
MKGIYVYCIYSNDEDRAGFKPSGKGIESSRVYPIVFGDIAAVASDIDLAKFGVKEIRNRLQNDPTWTERTVRQHHRVIAKLARSRTVIPMKFGVIFKTKQTLDKVFKRHFKKFKNLLADLEGKQEWGIKAYLERKKFIDFLKGSRKEIKAFKRERSSMPEGRKWYADRKIDKWLTEEFEAAIEAELQHIAGKLESSAEKVVLNELLPKELSERRDEEMVLNAACLFKNDRLNKFNDTVRAIQKECGKLGLTVLATGPWPPYNFASIDLEEPKI